MNRREMMAAALGGCLSKGIPLFASACPVGLPDIRSIAADLTTPPVEDVLPAPGKRVRMTMAAYGGTAVHHTLYLPTDWKPCKTYPVIIEYPGNGPWVGPCGDTSGGDVDGCNLGFGISAGSGFIWAALPFIDVSGQHNQLWWWGDVERTLDYCHAAVAEICSRYGGDRSAVILSGFSRGAIACNFIGLHDDSIAGLWLGFVASSHYDGVERWDWEGSDRATALLRLARLRGRRTFIAQEMSTANIEEYLRGSGVKDSFTIQTLPFHNHTDVWVLRDIPARSALRSWMDETLRLAGRATHGRDLGDFHGLR